MLVFTRTAINETEDSRESAFYCCGKLVIVLLISGDNVFLQREDRKDILRYAEGEQFTQCGQRIRILEVNQTSVKFGFIGDDAEVYRCDFDMDEQL